MTICTKCALPDDRCVCNDDDEQIDFDPDPEWVKDDVNIPRRVIDDVRAFNQQYDSELESFVVDFENAPVNGRNVRLIGAFRIATVQTPTSEIDPHVGNILSGDFGDLKRFIEATNDGPTKWSKLGSWFNTDLPEKVARHFNRLEPTKARALIAGRDESGHVRETYARTCKASLDAYLLQPSLGALCMDSRAYRYLSETGTLANAVDSEPRLAPDQDLADENPFRDQAVDISRSKSVSPTEPDWWQTKLKWNPQEYHAGTSAIVDAIASETGVEKARIPHILFNLGRPDDEPVTFHKELRSELK